MVEGGATIVGAHRKDGGELGESFTTGVTKVTMPQGGGGSVDGLGSRGCSGYRGPELLHLTVEQPVGSNSTEQLLSVVNWRTEIRFLMICGDTRTLLSLKEPDKSVELVAVTGRREPLPTIIVEGVNDQGADMCEKVFE